MNMSLYIMIFLFKFVETSIFSAKNVFLVSGEIKKATLLTFFEVFFWGLGTGSVVASVFSDFYVLIPLLLGSLIGVYVGMTIKDFFSDTDKLLISIINQNDLEKVLEMLFLKKHGVTVLDSEDFQKVLVIATKNNRMYELKKMILKVSKKATFISSDSIETVGTKYF